MVEYRQYVSTEATAGSSSQQPHTAAAPEHPPAKLTDRYSWARAMRAGGSADTSNCEMQTTEQEFQAYITAPLSKKNTDMIKFWEVCVYSMTSTQMND